MNSCIRDTNLWRKIFSASALADTSSMFLAVMNLINASERLLSLFHNGDNWTSYVVNGFTKYGCNPEVLMAGCKFISIYQLCYDELFLTNIMLSLLPHQNININIVVVTADAIRQFLRYSACNELLQALRFLLITYGYNEKIFRAIAHNLYCCKESTCSYFL